MTKPAPILEPVRVSKLRPTQMSVGLREVAAKRAEWRAEHGRKAAKWLGRHTVPVVRGPKERLYLIDHHHLARALHEEGVETLAVSVVADLSALARDEFWVFMDMKGWSHPYDAAGARQPIHAIPKRIADLEDDPYRSLAGELRRRGGFAKDLTPFAEFLWADFLRRRVSVDDWDAAVAQAEHLAHSPNAAHLPGWCGARG
jgi:hypothetical protein